MFGYDTQSTRSNPYEYILNSINVSNLALDWTATTTGSIVNNSSPVVADNIIYIADYSGTLSAFDAASGVLLWTYTDSQGSFSDAPTVVNGIVYITGGPLVALNAKTGLLLWTTSLSGGSFSGSPTIANGIIYSDFVSNGGSTYLVAINAITGGLLWEQYADNPGIASVANGPSIPQAVEQVFSMRLMQRKEHPSGKATRQIKHPE